MKKMMRTAVVYGLGIGAIVLLAGCWPFGKKKAGEEVEKGDVVLASLDGKPAVTKTKFYQVLRGAVGNMDPALLPKETQRKFLDNVIQYEVVVAQARKEALQKNPDFQKVYKEQKRHLKKALLNREYETKMFKSIEISDDEVKSDFERNKSKYVKEAGGVMTSGVSFSDKSKAMAFYDKVKSNPKEFASLGRKEKDGKFKEFGRIGEGAPAYGPQAAPKAVRESVGKLSKFPSVDFVKEGKETWVILAQDKTDAVHFEFNEIKERLRNQLKMNKFSQIRAKKYEELKKNFTIDVNEEYFKEPKKEEPPKEEPKAEPKKEEPKKNHKKETRR